jgi:hypothetical protein
MRILGLKLLDRIMYQNLFRQLKMGEFLKKASLSLQYFIYHIRLQVVNIVFIMISIFNQASRRLEFWDKLGIGNVYLRNRANAGVIIDGRSYYQ